MAPVTPAHVARGTRCPEVGQVGVRSTEPAGCHVVHVAGPSRASRVLEPAQVAIALEHIAPGLSPARWPRGIHSSHPGQSPNPEHNGHSPQPSRFSHPVTSPLPAHTGHSREPRHMGHTSAPTLRPLGQTPSTPPPVHGGRYFGPLSASTRTRQLMAPPSGGHGRPYRCRQGFTSQRLGPCPRLGGHGWAVASITRTSLITPARRARVIIPPNSPRMVCDSTSMYGRRSPSWARS